MKFLRTTHIQKGMTTEFTHNGARIRTWVEKESFTVHQNKIDQFHVTSPPSHSFSLLHQMPSSYLLLTLYSSSNPFQNSLAYIHWRTSISFSDNFEPMLKPSAPIHMLNFQGKSWNHHTWLQKSYKWRQNEWKKKFTLDNVVNLINCIFLISFP